jgi:hypothetical protein
MACRDCYFLPTDRDKDKCARTGKQITPFLLELEWECEGWEAKYKAAKETYCAVGK